MVGSCWFRLVLFCLPCDLWMRPWFALWFGWISTTAEPALYRSVCTLSRFCVVCVGLDVRLLIIKVCGWFWLTKPALTRICRVSPSTVFNIQDMPSPSKRNLHSILPALCSPLPRAPALCLVPVRWLQLGRAGSGMSTSASSMEVRVYLSGLVFLPFVVLIFLAAWDSIWLDAFCEELEFGFGFEF